MSFLLRLGVALLLERRRERRRVRHAKDRRMADTVMLSFLTRQYARHGASEHVESMVEQWHGRETWAHREGLR